MEANRLMKLGEKKLSQLDPKYKRNKEETKVTFKKYRMINMRALSLIARYKITLVEIFYEYF